MVAILALIAQTFVQSSSQPCPLPTLGLSKSASRLMEFMGMGNLLASRECKKRVETRINAYGAIASMGNNIGLCVDEEAEIPSRGSFDDAATFETPCREGLRMKADMPYAWNMDTCALWGFKRIREGDARQLVPLAFEPWLLRQLLIASLPGRIRHIEQALQGVTGNAELFAMIGKEVMKGLGRVVDTIVPILLDFADSPIPHASELEQPGLKLCFLPCVEA